MTSGSGTAVVSMVQPMQHVRRYETSVTFNAAPVVGPNA